MFWNKNKQVRLEPANKYSLLKLNTKNWVYKHQREIIIAALIAGSIGVFLLCSMFTGTDSSIYYNGGLV